MEEQKEVITLFDVVMKATHGDTTDLEEVIQASKMERNNLITNVNQKVTEMNAQIQLLTTILEQAKNKNKE